MTGLPDWLLCKYTFMLVRFGLLPFTVDDARKIVSDKPAAALVLSRLSKRGWVERWAPAEYRVVHPTIAMMKASGSDWTAKTLQRERLPLVELAVARFVEEFAEKLVSVILFGSLARGQARPESDIDLILVTEDLPKSYGERVELGRRMLSSRAIEDWTIRLWGERGVYANFDLTLLTPEEAMKTHPPYLDLVEDSIRIIDRGDFMLKVVARLKERLREIGAFKVTLPDGTWYWNLAKSAKEAKELVL